MMGVGKILSIAKHLAMVAVVSCLPSCATDGVALKDQNYSLTEIRSAFAKMMGEPRLVDQKLRTYTSQFFSKKPDPKFDSEKSKERFYAVFEILGDRRPYTIRIEVFREKKEATLYVNAGQDIGLAKTLKTDLKETLHLGRARRNVIDHFRPF